jgi:hypothetical protein
MVVPEKIHYPTRKAVRAPGKRQDDVLMPVPKVGHRFSHEIPQPGFDLIQPIQQQDDAFARIEEGVEHGHGQPAIRMNEIAVENPFGRGGGGGQTVELLNQGLQVPQKNQHRKESVFPAVTTS